MVYPIGILAALVIAIARKNQKRKSEGDLREPAPTVSSVSIFLCIRSERGMTSDKRRVVQIF